MRKTSVYLNRTQRQGVASLVAESIRHAASNELWDLDLLIERVLEYLPIEDLYSRDYLIATGEAIAREDSTDEA